MVYLRAGIPHPVYLRAGMPDLAVSSWSLHRTLGPIYPALDVHPGERAAELPYGPGHLCLLDAPAYVAALGISAFEVCHFHFPCTDPAYLARLRHSFCGGWCAFGDPADRRR
jgi:hypothetical protein